MNVPRLLNTAIAILLLLPGSFAQQPTTLNDQVRRIFEAREYTARSFGQAEWSDDGGRFTTVEGSDIVAYDAASGKRDVLVSASILQPNGSTKPLAINGYSWSTDHRRILIFTNSKKVWRANTRGDY